VKREKAPPGETKAAKFMRVANSRIDKTIQDIHNIAAMANPKVFEYTDAQAAAIITILRAAVSRVERNFFPDK
jgi:hypothetical protein